MQKIVILLKIKKLCTKTKEYEVELSGDMEIICPN